MARAMTSLLRKKFSIPHVTYRTVRGHEVFDMFTDDESSARSVGATW